MFATARQQKATEIIIDQIRTAILAGRLVPGDRLPPERELGEQFQVSKQTLREAMRALEHMGLIEVRKGVGGGAFIVEVDATVASRNLANYLYFKSLTIENLSEMRRIMEPYAARRAAENIGTQDLKAIERLNAAARKHLSTGNLAAVSRDEIHFHRLIARQTGNPMLTLVLEFVETLLEDFKKILGPDAAFMEGVLLAHDSILAAIEAGDADAAAARMLTHVVAVETHLSRLKKEKNGKQLWENCLQATSAGSES